MCQTRPLGIYREYNGSDVNAHGGDLGNALQAASARGYEKVVQLLLDNGADINKQGGCYGSREQEIDDFHG